MIIVLFLYSSMKVKLCGKVTWWKLIKISTSSGFGKYGLLPYVKLSHVCVKSELERWNWTYTVIPVWKWLPVLRVPSCWCVVFFLLYILSLDTLFYCQINPSQSSLLSCHWPLFLNVKKNFFSWSIVDSRGYVKFLLYRKVLQLYIIVIYCSFPLWFIRGHWI